MPKHDQWDMLEAAKALYPSHCFAPSMADSAELRFNPLFLDFGEMELQDWAVAASSSALQDTHTHYKTALRKRGGNSGTVTSWNTTGSLLWNSTQDRNPSIAMKNVHGRLRLCTKSIIFEPQDDSRAIIKCPLDKLSSFPTLGDVSEEAGAHHVAKTIVISTRKHFLIKANNIIAPFISVDMPTEFRFLFLHSQPNVFLQLMQNISTWKNKGIVSFDYGIQQPFHPLNLHPHEKGARRNLFCFFMTPLVHTPGCFVITQTCLHFQTWKARTSTKTKKMQFSLLVIACMTIIFKVSILLIQSENSILARSFDVLHDPSPKNNATTSFGPPILVDGIVDAYLYQPSVLEDYFLKHTTEMGYNASNASICKNWIDPSSVTPEIATQEDSYLKELAEYAVKVKNFRRKNDDVSILEEISQVYQNGKGKLSWDDASKAVCKTLRLPFFLNHTHLLSFSSHVGSLEPLLPPMRHPGWCKRTHGKRTHGLMSLEYIIHDFYQLCRNLKPTSKIVLIDMGASLDFHGDSSNAPPIFLLNTFRQFGFFFDHVYAYESTKKKPEDVFNAVPQYLIPAYHWMNIPVQIENNTYLNPLQMVLHEFKEEDLVLVKLDIDTPHLENPMAYQMLETDPGTGRSLFGNLIDLLYFEHHVLTVELAGTWGTHMKETVEESLRLFEAFRKHGIAAHFWP